MAYFKATIINIEIRKRCLGKRYERDGKKRRRSKKHLLSNISLFATTDTGDVNLKNDTSVH